MWREREREREREKTVFIGTSCRPFLSAEQNHVLHLVMEQMMHPAEEL